MAISKGFRFPVKFHEAFPQGLVLLGDIVPATRYNPNPNAPVEQLIDWNPKTEVGTQLPVWKASVTDPHEDKAKRASFEVLFVSSHQPVPASPEIVPGTGMRMVELEGLTAEPKVMGQGEFKYQGYTFRATGIKGDTNTPKPNAAANGSAVKAGA